MSPGTLKPGNFPPLASPLSTFLGFHLVGTWPDDEAISFLLSLVSPQSPSDWGCFGPQVARSANRLECHSWGQGATCILGVETRATTERPTMHSGYNKG